MKHCDERPRIDQDDKGFADRLAAHYAQHHVDASVVESANTL